MAKARAIVKRRKAVRNIRKITKTMQMIATAKFQKALKRSQSAKPYTRKVRELVAELAASLGDVQHPLLRKPEAGSTGKTAIIVLTSNRGLAGAYNGNVLRQASHFISKQESSGGGIDLYVSGKKGATFFNYQRRPIAGRYEQFADAPRYADVQKVADEFMEQFTSGKVDAVNVAYMNFVSAGTQRPEVMSLLPISQIKSEGEAAPAAGGNVLYDFYPSAKELLDELLPLMVRTALFQSFLDAAASENVARMVAMKSATDNADKMVKSLTMQYNRARQSQITTELAEIMGGVEAMKGRA